MSTAQFQTTLETPHQPSFIVSDEPDLPLGLEHASILMTIDELPLDKLLAAADLAKPSE